MIPKAGDREKVFVVSTYSDESDDPVIPEPLVSPLFGPLATI